MSLLHDILNPGDPLRSVFTPVKLNTFVDTKHRNLEIQRVYTRIVAEIRELLSRMSSTEHRTYLLTGNEASNKYDDQVLFEFTCIACEVRLSVKHYCYRLELETSSEIQKLIGSYNYRKMLRIAYFNTGNDCTEHYLEDCIDIVTDMADHYCYFKNRLANSHNENSIVLEEEAIIE